MILGGEDVAGGPGDLCAQLQKGLDEDGGLDGHVETSSDPGTLQGLGRSVLLPQVHETRHFIFSDLEFFATELGQVDVG